MAGGKSNINKAGRLQEQKLQLWQDVYSDPQFGKVQPVSKGELSYYGGTPALERVAREDSAFDAMPGEGRGAQLRSLDYFENLARGGEDAVAEADYARRTAQAEQRRRANTEAALQQAEMRGMGAGGGGALTAALSSAQGQATDQYGAGLEAAAQTQQRRDAAAGAAGNLGGAVQGQDLETARAQDAWNDWYRTNAADVNAQNWGRTNTVSDANVGLKNENTYWNKDREQQNFQNKMAALQGLSGAYDTSTDRSMGAANIRAGQKSTGEKIAGAIGDTAKIGAQFIPKPA